MCVRGARPWLLAAGACMMMWAAGGLRSSAPETLLLRLLLLLPPPLLPLQLPPPRDGMRSPHNLFSPGSMLPAGRNHLQPAHHRRLPGHVPCPHLHGTLGQLHA